MKQEEINAYLSQTFQGFAEGELPGLTSGKVRDIIDLDTKLLITTSDRISAFDRILTTIPCKGEVLNRISLYWFKNTEDIVPNHIDKAVSGRSVLVNKGEVLPVEVIVRGYLTGSAWRDYQSGKAVSGIGLPSGMKMNQRFETPLLTPSTKAELGQHDEPISSDEVVSSGLVDKALWDEVSQTALKLFRRGADLAARQGLILVDTKYEFGLINGKLHVVDEVHTPDSSRYWYADTYQKRFEKGEKQRKIDKEYLRQWLMERGFMGDGEAPDIPDEVRVEVAWRYIQAYQTITGEDFQPEGLSIEAEKEKIRSVLS
jgi:phosphoribosylaminoimidazole-succinocarboxamide synthase